MASAEDKENDGVAYRIGVLPTSKRARKPRTQDKDADDFSAKMTDISLVCQAKAAHDDWEKRRIYKQLLEGGKEVSESENKNCIIM